MEDERGPPSSDPRLDVEPADAPPLDASPVDATPLDASPVDATPLDASPVDATPLDASPVDISPGDDVTGEMPPRGSSAEPAPPSAPVASDRVTNELPPRRAADDDAPTLEIEPAPPSRDAETQRRPEEPKKARRKARWLRRIAVAILAVVAACAVALALAYDPIVRWYVLFEAERRGIVIDAREMDVTWGRASFWDASVHLDGAPALGMHVDWLEVQALGFHPTSAKVRGVDAEASSVDALRQVLAFGRTHRGDLVPFTATDVRLAIGRGASGSAPVLEAKVADVTYAPGDPLLARGAAIVVARPRITVGPIDIVADARGALVHIGLGPDLQKSPVRVEADLDSRQLAIELPATPASTIAGWLGRKPSPGGPPWPGAFSIKASVKASWGPDARSDVVGHVDATLLGLVPPHPPELNGIATGNDTIVAFDVRAGPRDEGISLDKLRVGVGSLHLEGVGRIVPREPSFIATANLRGSIPCTELVGSVAVGQLGLPLGSALGSLVRSNIAGNVDVAVAIRVDGERIASPEVKPSATIGCRLRLLGG